MNLIYLILIIIILILFVWQVSNLISILAGTLYVKTESDLIDFALTKAGLNSNDIFYDLGCGNGDVVIAAEKLGAHATGYEISPFYFLLSKIKTINIPKVKIYFKNIKDVNLNKADVVFCYLVPEFLIKLKNKFLTDRPKTIISIGFEIKGLPNKKSYYFKNRKIFIYSLRSR